MKTFNITATISYTHTIQIEAKDQDEAIELFTQNADAYIEEIVKDGDEDINYDIEEEE